MITVISREKSAFDGRAISSGNIPVFELCILCASASSEISEATHEPTVYVSNFDIDGDDEPYQLYCAPGSIIIVPSESKKFVLSPNWTWYEWNPSDPGKTLTIS